MGKVKIGFSRMYDAGACSNEGEGDISAAFHFGSFDVYFHAGTGLKHHVFTFNWGPPVPKDSEQEPKPTKKKGQRMPKEEDFPADYYVEIYAQQWLDVDDTLAEAFYAGDASAQNQLSELLKQQKDEFLTAIDFTAGVFGLKLHKVLVFKPIHEQSYIYRDSNSTVFSADIAVTVTDTYRFDREDVWQTEIKKAAATFPGEWKGAAKPLAWLLRAWGAEDGVLRCFSLLTALEQVIPRATTTEEKIWKESRTKLLSLVNQHADTSEVYRLTAWVESIPRPATALLTRFQRWAESAGHPGWKKDVDTFKKFNRIRNLLFHSGTPAGDHKLKVVLKQLEELEDVAERYISFALFKDMTVYPHPLRKF